MWTDNAIFFYLIFILGVLITPYMSYAVEFLSLKLLKSSYQDIHHHEDEDVIFFSCWTEKNNNFYIHAPVHILNFVSVLWFFYYFDWQFIVFFFCVILLDIVLYWNTLVKINLSKDSLHLARLVFGTETEFYHLTMRDIIKIETKTMKKHFPFVGFKSWTLIHLTKGKILYISSPNAEDNEVFIDYFTQTHALIHQNDIQKSDNNVENDVSVSKEEHILDNPNQPSSHELFFHIQNNKNK